MRWTGSSQDRASEGEGRLTEYFDISRAIFYFASDETARNNRANITDGK